jgi:hypothetical protein
MLYDCYHLVVVGDCQECAVCDFEKVFFVGGPFYCMLVVMVIVGELLHMYGL